MAITREQVVELVERKNKAAEECVGYRANQLISNIVDAQRQLREETQKANEKIAAYRKELAELSFETVTVAEILGEEGEA